MAEAATADVAQLEDSSRLRYSVSSVRQGRHVFYTLTVPSDVLARTCVVSTRKENPSDGFQRELDEKRAIEIAHYIDEDVGTIPSSIVLSAQPEADLKIVGRGKTLEFNDTPRAFLILDGQHRVFGFSKARTMLRVPVVVYNGLSRTDETRLFIDINTKQRPVPPQLLLDIKKQADIEGTADSTLRDIFDSFDQSMDSALAGYMAPSDSARNKINRVTFNAAMKPLLELFSGRDGAEIYQILNAYLQAITAELTKKTNVPLLTKPVVFRAFMGIFRYVAQRVVDKYSADYSAARFQEILAPIFPNFPMKKLEQPGTSWVALRDYLETRLKSKLTL